MLDNNLGKLGDKIDELYELAEELETDFAYAEGNVDISADELTDLIEQIEKFRNKAYKFISPEEYEPDWDLIRDERRFE